MYIATAQNAHILWHRSEVNANLFSDPMLLYHRILLRRQRYAEDRGRHLSAYSTSRALK